MSKFMIPTHEFFFMTRTELVFVRNITAIFMMEDSSEDEREMLREVRKKSFVPRGPTTMSELASVRNSGQKLPIQFNEHGQPVGATSKKMQSYIGVCVRQQIPITYNSWKEVPNELKDKIYDCISKITHDVSYRSTLWKEARKGRNNDYFDDATRDCASRIDELVATHQNENILTDALGSKEHGGRVRGVGVFVSQSQYFNTVKGKEKMITPQVEICYKEEDDSRCKIDKKRSSHSRSSIGSINIDLDDDEDLVNTPSNKRVEGTPCQLFIGSINNIVAVSTIVEDIIGCPNVKVLVDMVTGENLTIPNLEHSTRKDVVYSSNYTDVNGTIKLLNRHAVNNMKDVDMIRIPMNELIFGSDKFVYLAREDLLHYCGMVEIGYMCILAYITYLWDECDCARNFFVIDQSKISSHIKDRDLRSRNLANQLEAVNLEQKVLIPYNTGFHWMLHVIDLRENCVYVLDSLRSKVNEDIHGVINVGLKTWQAKHDLQRYRSTPKWRPVKCPRQLDSVGCGYYVQKYIHEIVHNSSTSITSLFNTKNAYRQEEIDEIRTKWAAFFSMEVYAGISGILVCIASELDIRFAIE
uniref:Ubiquitin-like protease family profile domain-containing protein n=1 Tax=Cucumis melo TaxID=3656 RepID=A0A9I9E4F4_CUCME